MIYAHWLILAVYALTVLGTMLAVLTDNRQPAKTMAWLLVLTFLPIAGIILYFFFGRNTRKERLIEQQSLDQLTKRSMLTFVEQKNLHVPEQYETLVRFFANQGMALPFKDNEVKIFADGCSFFLSLLRDIGQATQHIHIDTYIVEDDPLGRLVTDALAEKASQGVEVRFIYDDVGCWRVPNRFFERMREAGIETHAFMPVKFPAFTGKVNYRNHRKICVVDGQVGYIGGMNIAQRYVKGTGQQPWRDTHLRITGGAVYALQRAFLVDWYFVDRTLISDRKYYPEGTISIQNDCLAQVVTSSSNDEWPDIELGYARILLEAKRYVYMQTPYFIPTENVLQAMQTAALAGVDVRLMIPKHCDALLAEWASRSYVRQAAQAGVKVYLYESGFNHSKVLVSDDSLCTCGSTNIDFRSFENNFEANIFFYDEAMAKRMKALFLADQAQSSLLKEKALSGLLPFLGRLWESVVRLLAPLL